MKRITFILAAVFLSLGVTSQGFALAGTRTVIDQQGKPVSIPHRVDKIVTFCIPLPLVIYAVDGCGDKIAGMHPKSKAALEKNMLGVLAPELRGSESRFVKGKTMFNVNIEELIKLSPDVVFQWARMKDDIRMMEKAGIPVIALDVRTYEDITGWIRIVGEVLDKPEKAGPLIEYHRRTAAMIASRTQKIPPAQKPRAVFINNLKNGSISVVGKHSFYNFVTGLTGVENCAKDLFGRGGKRVNMEQMLIWNPEIIFIGNLTGLQPSDLFTNKGWQLIEAVKAHRVYKIPDAGFWWYPPGLESPLYFKWLAQKLHPELFDDYSMVSEIQGFYRTFYRYSLSDEMAAEILNARNQTPNAQLPDASRTRP